MRPLPWILATAVLVTGCGSENAAGCVELREPEDPASGQHVLADGTFEYRTDPPTSGAHVAGPTPTGVLDTTVPPAIQIRLLEAGGVMVQYDVDAIDVGSLAALGDELTVVAPGADLPAPIVATAWTWKLSCSEVDIGRIERFGDERRTDAPGLD